MRNEVERLQFFESKTCDSLPKLLSADFSLLEIVQSNCVQSLQHLTQRRQKELVASLQAYGVEHADPELRNVTYRFSDGVFCVVGSEFATLLHFKSLEKLDWIAREVANGLS